MTDLSQYSDADLAVAAGLPVPVATAPTPQQATPVSPWAHVSDEDLKAAAGLPKNAPLPKAQPGTVEPSFQNTVMAQIPFASDAVGLGNAITGFLFGPGKAPGGGTIQGQSFGADYDQGKKDFWAANDEYKQEHPVLAKLAQGLGFINSLGRAPGAGAATALPENAAELGNIGAGTAEVAAPAGAVAGEAPGGGLLAQSLRSGAVAAPVGAAYSFGLSGDDLEGRARSAALGGITGGALGSAAPAIGRVASNVFGNIADKSGLSGSALGNFLGVATPEDKASGLLAKALLREPGNLTPADIAANLAVNPAKPMTIADAGAVGGPIARLTRGVLDRPGVGGATGTQFLADRDLGTPVNGAYDMFRQGGAADRIIGDAQAAFGAGSAPQTIDQLIAKGDADSAPLYNAFRAENPVPAEKIAPFMSSPTFRSALSRANTTALDRGENPFADLIDYNEAGDPISVKNGAFPPQTLDQIKQGIDDTWLAAKASGDRGATSTANNLRSRFLGFMDDQFPNTYPQARAAFAGPAVSRDAIQQGMNVFNTAPEDVSKTLQALNPEDQNNFRLGVQQAIVNKVKNTQDGANEVAKIFGNPAKRESVAAAFTDPDALNQFSQNLGIENRMAATKNLTAGSRTAPSMADQNELEGGLADAAAHTVGGNYLGAATRLGGLALGSLRAGASEKTGSALARILLNPDQAVNAATLARIAQAPQGSSPLLGALLAGGAAGQLGGAP